MIEQDLFARAEAHLAEAIRLLQKMRQPLAERRAMHHQLELSEVRIAYSVREVQQRLGLGRTTIYKAIKQGRLKVVKEGSRTLILQTELASWLKHSSAPKSAASG